MKTRKYKITLATKEGILVDDPIELEVGQYVYLSSEDFQVYVERVEDDDAGHI